MNKGKLMQFQEEIKELFLEGKIKAPIHLSRGNEESLIEIFKQIHEDDWVFSTHRSHYHALLKGVAPKWLKNEILAGRSIHIMNQEHNFFTSAIVGGAIPIALGVALAIKQKGENRHVWCFIGDMASETGMFHECTKYARNHDLPISFVVEDNGLSNQTPTAEVWGLDKKPQEKVTRYSYNRVWPHQGAGQWVKF